MFFNALISMKDDILISNCLSLSLDWFSSWEREELIIIEPLKNPNSFLRTYFVNLFIFMVIGEQYAKDFMPFNVK